MDSASEAVHDAAARSSEAANSLIDNVRSRAASTYGATRTAAARISDSTAALGRAVGDHTQDLLEFCKEQPLVLVGLGIAVGAAMGAALPTTETENKLMGEASDAVKDRARRVADKAKDKAQASLEQIKDQVQSPNGQPTTEERYASRAPEKEGANASAVSDSASTAPPSSEPVQMVRQESGHPEPRDDSLVATGDQTRS